MTNKAIARILKETAALIELTGGNPFRSRAFSNAARTIERLDDPVPDLLRDGTLQQIKGIGSGLAAQIGEILDGGSFTLRDDLLASLPPGLLELLRVKGMGAKRVRQVWQTLGVTTLEELEAAASTGRLSEIDGFGVKTQEKVLAQIQLLKQYQRQRRYANVVPLMQELLGVLRADASVERAEPSGAYRRKLDVLSEARLLVATTAPDAVRALLDAHLDETTWDADAGLVTGRLADAFTAEVRLAAPDVFGSTWWRDTGSEAHCAAFEAAHGAVAPATDEETVYARAGLAWIPPELREGTDELDAAREDALPPLITPDDLRGTLHNHSKYSDGAHSLRQMAEAARAMGLQYFGICDHSRSLKIANGLPPERVREQQREIAALNAEFAGDGGPPFKIFSGIESDILVDGSLDYDEDVLASFDLVVASVHVGMNMTEEQATARVIRAIHNPYTTILGHPTGRLLLAREGYPLDHEAVIAACAEAGVAIELNANPYRLDLDWRWIREATRQGVLISINPDAHSIDGLHDMVWGVEVARKGWLTAEQCLNAKPLEAFEAWLDQRRSVRIA